MKKTKKILSLVLVVLMLISALPLVVNATGYNVGDVIQFGSYPQTEVTDKDTIAALNSLAPDWSNWTSYGYYSGTGEIGTMAQGDWMKYTDVAYNGATYRGVKFTQYRPYWTWTKSSNTYQDDNGYTTNIAFWFKFEPLSWQVLEPTTGFVISKICIDAQPYNNTIYFKNGSVKTFGYYNDLSYTNFANDYESSFIRKWLNCDFYNIAFTNNEKKRISNTNISNNGYYTSKGIAGYEKLDSKSTSDNIFLLSYNEAVNNSFGFCSNSSDFDIARRTYGTDYAKAQGLHVYPSDYKGNSYWLLRSPGDHSDRCCYVDGGGYSDNYDYFCTYISSYGIRPAMYIDLEKLSNDNIYNLGEETYSFDNYVDTDSKGGHCFGMSVTSSGYHLGLLNPTDVGANSSREIYKLSENNTVKEPICYYQGIQGSIRNSAFVAGGNGIATDWDEVINYVKDHEYDNKGNLVIGYGKINEGGHAINFLRYEIIDGQERIYAYDNNEPDRETYFYEDENGNIKQAVYQTFSGAIDHFMALMSVPQYMSAVKTATNYQHMAIYGNSAIEIENANQYLMYGKYVSGEYYVYEIPEGVTTVKIKPLVENATFTYMEQEYRFGEINEDTYAEFTLSTSEEDTPEFKIINAPEDEPENKPCSCNCHKGGISGFFFKIINFFEKLFGKNKVCACGVKH